MYSLLLLVKDSKIRPFVLNHTIVLSNTVSDTYNTMNDIYKLKDKYEATEEKDYEALSRDSIETMLKYKIVRPEYLKSLKEKNRLPIQGIDKVIQKYEKR